MSVFGTVGNKVLSLSLNEGYFASFSSKKNEVKVSTNLGLTSSSYTANFSTSQGKVTIASNQKGVTSVALVPILPFKGLFLTVLPLGTPSYELSYSLPIPKLPNNFAKLHFDSGKKAINVEVSNKFSFRNVNFASRLSSSCCGLSANVDASFQDFKISLNSLFSPPKVDEGDSSVESAPKACSCSLSNLQSRLTLSAQQTLQPVVFGGSATLLSNVVKDGNLYVKFSSKVAAVSALVSFAPKFKDAQFRVNFPLKRNSVAASFKFSELTEKNISQGKTRVNLLVESIKFGGKYRCDKLGSVKALVALNPSITLVASRQVSKSVKVRVGVLVEEFKTLKRPGLSFNFNFKDNE